MTNCFKLFSLFTIYNYIAPASKFIFYSADPQKKYLFLGDYVDRGQFSCEVMLYLLSLKVKYPDRIWLLRGNHECRTVSSHFGFLKEVEAKYGKLKKKGKTKKCRSQCFKAKRASIA